MSKIMILAVIVIFFGCLFPVCAQETEQEYDKIYQQSIYYGLAFYVTLFPDEGDIDENGNGFYTVNFWFGQLHIDYKVMIENYDYYGTMISVQDCVYSDFFDGLQEDDYISEESASAELPQEKFEIHREHFYSLAMEVSNRFPNVSKLIWTMHQIITVNNELVDLDEDSELVEDYEVIVDQLTKLKEDLIEEIRRGKVIIEEEGILWLIVPELLDDGTVEFSIYEQPSKQYS